MGEVIDISSRNPDRWVSGPMLCTACKHEWNGVVPAGMVSGWECPECKCVRAVLKYPVIPPTIWTCKCGGDLFHLTPEGALCRECGAEANGWQG
jgi:hypothetical protein